MSNPFDFSGPSSSYTERCPYCRSTEPAIIERRTSTAGIVWACVIGIVLMVLAIPSCGIALVFLPVCVLPMIWCIETRAKCRDCRKWLD